MSEAAERVVAGEERAGQACGYCNAALEAEDEAAVCSECASVHHEACWDSELGCSKAGCINAPLKRLDAPPPAPPGREGAQAQMPRRPAPQPQRRKKAAPDGAKICVGCNATLPKYVEVCDSCYTINTPDGLYHGPKTTAPGAKEALIMAIVGLFLCGPILGGMAIGRANKAREAIRIDPRLGGDGLALAALILGVLDIAVWMISIVTRVGGMR